MGFSCHEHFGPFKDDHDGEERDGSNSTLRGVRHFAQRWDPGFQKSSLSSDVWDPVVHGECLPSFFGRGSAAVQWIFFCCHEQSFKKKLIF